jgi:hypothetical protein
MAKRTHRYPRKLRQTLEKVAAGRQEREAANPDDESIPPSFHSFYQSGLLRKVDTMYTRLNDANTKAVTTFEMNASLGNPRIFVPPPWVAKPDSDAS